MEVVIIFISWLGNSSFLIKTSIGKRILIDPINKFHSCNITNLKPNLITLSSESFKCNCISNVDSSTIIISNADTYQNDIYSIKGISTFNDNLNGLKRGTNLLFIYEIDNIKLCHLGYLGHMLSDDIISILKNCDILFLPIGGNITLDGKTAYKLSKLINPKLIIPMNYKFNPYSYLFNGPQDYLLLSKNIKKIKEESFFVSHSSLPSTTLNTVLLSPLLDNNII